MFTALIEGATVIVAAFHKDCVRKEVALIEAFIHPAIKDGEPHNVTSVQLWLNELECKFHHTI
jgi:hypothetical protein